jgi:multidrug efflux pump
VDEPDAGGHLNMQRQPGANTISVVKSIKQLLPQLEANLPPGIEVTTLTDLDHAIQASVTTSNLS